MGSTARIPGIVPKGPAASLLTASSRFPQGADWQSGVEFRQTNCFASGRIPQCGVVNKEDPNGAGLASFYPFTAYLPASCDWLSPKNVEGEYDPEVQAQMDAASSWHMSRELWTGETNRGTGEYSPSLQAPFPGETDEFDETHIISGGALNPIDGLGRLLEAYTEGTDVGGAVLHVPTALITRLIADYDVVLNGQIYNVPGQATVSPGPGYPRVGSTGPRVSGDTDGLPATSTQAWVYVSGPVETEMLPITLEPTTQDQRYMDRRTNQYYVEAQRKMIYRFDPCSVWAALITLPAAS